MKYIAYYGAWGTCWLCLMLALIKTIVGILNIHKLYDPIDASLDTLSIVVCMFVSVACAWIVCDMQKKMKGL